MILLNVRQGLGDNIYARPFVRAYAEAHDDVVVRTPWPQLFADLRVAVEPPSGFRLRTQKKNVARIPADTWSQPASSARAKSFEYRLKVLGRSILQEIGDNIGWPDGQPFIFDLPTFAAPQIDAERIAVVRPVTLRREWPNRARNPEARYVARAAEMLRHAGYHVVCVADIDYRHEPAIEPLPVGDTMLVNGELNATELLGLIQRADIVVGGCGWIVPASMAYGTPAVIIGGGNGGHNAPELLTDPRVDCSRMRFILPDNYCRCVNMRHGCMKVIRGFDAQFAEALSEVAPAMGRAA